MKKLIMLLSMAATALSGSDAFGGRNTNASPVASADDRQMYRMTRFEGQPITGVAASVGFRVELNESANTSVRVEIPAEYKDLLICEISPEGVVRLGINTEGLKRGFRSRDLTAVVNLGRIDRLNASVGARIACNGSFTGGHVDLSASTSGKISGLVLTADAVEIQASTAGEIQDLDITAEQGTEVDLSASTSGKISGLVLTAPAVEIKASTAGVIRDLDVTAEQVTAVGTTSARMSGVTLDAAKLFCTTSTKADFTVAHTGQSTILKTSVGGAITITGSTKTLSVNKSRTGGSINTSGYKASYRVQ